MELEIILILISFFGIISLLIAVNFSLRKKLKLTFFALGQRQSQATRLGQNTALGNIHEILGKFAFLTEYPEIYLLSTTSRNASLDCLGVKEDSLDFIEIKKSGARITPKENKIRRLVEEGKVSYVVKDVELPDGCTVENRELPSLRQQHQPKEEMDAILNKMKT